VSLARVSFSASPLTIAGGVRDAPLGWRLEREEIVRPRRLWPTLLRGPSASPLDAMRALPLVVAVVLGAAPAASIACTCAGTQSIGNALTIADAVVVGRVKKHLAPDYSQDHPRPGTVDVEVIDSLKGGITGNVEIAKTLACYQSFPEEDLEIGKSYVFPLTRIDLANPDDTVGLMIGSGDRKIPSYKMFRLPVCSHNALLLKGQALYTNELTASGGRRLDYYLPLSLVKVLLPIGLLSAWGVTALIVVAIIVCVVGIAATRRRRRESPMASNNRWRGP
jgi:hypothetical protein